MPNWKKVAVSGSSPVFNNITASGNISASGYISASSFVGDGSGLTGVPFSGAQTKFNVFQTGSGTDSVKPINGSNIVSGNCSTILGGCNNSIDTVDEFNTILSGRCHQISGSRFSGILGGQCNIASYTDCSLISGDSNKIIDVTNGSGNYRSSTVTILGGSSNDVYSWYEGNNLSTSCRALNIGLFNSNNSTISGSRQISMLGGIGHDVVTTASNGSHSSTICNTSFIGGIGNKAGSNTISSVVNNVNFIGGTSNCAFGGEGAIIGGESNCFLYPGSGNAVIIGGCHNTQANNTGLSGKDNSVIVGGRYNSIDGAVCSGILGGSSNCLKLTRNSYIYGSYGNHEITGSSNISPNISSENTIIGGCNVNLYNTSGIIAMGVHNRTISNCQLTSTKVLMDDLDVCNLSIQTSISAPQGTFGTNTTIIDDNIKSTGDFELTGSIYAKTDITASGNISASGDLFFSASENSSTSYKTLVIDPTTGKVFKTGSYAGGGGGGTFPFTGDAVITGSLLISSSQAYNQSLKVLGSGSTVFDVIGSAGNLLTVDDDLSGTLFIANDQNGIPSLEVSASGEVYLGRAPQSLYTTVQKGPWTTTETLISYPTASYNSIFVEYTAYSENNAQVGNQEGMVVPTVPGSQTPTAGGTSFNNTGGRAWLNFKYILINGILKVDMTANTTNYPNVYIKAIIKAI